MRTLVLVWAALLALLGLTVALSRAPLGPSAGLAAALAVSAAKSLLVLLFFMELRRARWAQRLAAAGALLMLCLLIAGTLADFLTRGRDAAPSAPPAAVTAPVRAARRM